MGQVWGWVPGLAPVPPHASQFSLRKKSTDFSQPKAASSKVMVMRCCRSLPWTGPGSPRTAAHAAKEGIKDAFKAAHAAKAAEIKPTCAAAAAAHLRAVKTELVVAFALSGSLRTSLASLSSLKRSSRRFCRWGAGRDGIPWLSCGTRLDFGPRHPAYAQHHNNRALPKSSPTYFQNMLYIQTECPGAREGGGSSPAPGLIGAMRSRITSLPRRRRWCRPR